MKAACGAVAPSQDRDHQVIGRSLLPVLPAGECVHCPKQLVELRDRFDVARPGSMSGAEHLDQSELREEQAKKL
jgi:hypothetical protein